MTDAATHDDAVLDAPVRHSLAGAHRHLAITLGRTARYPADVTPFMALPPSPTDADWSDLARLADGDPIVLVDPPPGRPATWRTVETIPCQQMVGTDLVVRPEPDRGLGDLVIERLHADDAAAMLALTGATKPGPFRNRTNVLGTYYGLRCEDGLAAMAGERLRPDGWVEISAVCTDPRFRGRGLARSLVESVIDGAIADNRRPFLHVADENVGAIALYRAMGFVTRRALSVEVLLPT